MNKLEQRRPEIEATLAKIREYIKETPIENSAQFNITGSEIVDIAMGCDAMGRVAFAFQYGRAMGYRAAKASEKQSFFKRLLAGRSKIHRNPGKTD